MPPIPDKYDWARDERPTATFSAGPVDFLRYTWPYFFFAALALGFACIGFFVPAREAPVVGMIVGLVGVLIAVAMVAWGAVVWTKVVRHARLYPDGVMWLEGGRWRGARWDEIEELYRVEIYVNNSPSKKEIVVKSSRGVKGTLTHALPRWAKLAEAVQMQATMALGPAARARFKAGEALVFGPVKVSVRGIKVNDEVMHWEDVASIRVSNGYLNVVPRGKRTDGVFVSLAEVPNYLVLLKILEESPGPKPTVGK
jgi:hypothetical protein